MHGCDGTRARRLRPRSGWRSTRIALLASFSEAICCGVLMSGSTLAIPSTGFRTSRRAMDEPVEIGSARSAMASAARGGDTSPDEVTPEALWHSDVHGNRSWLRPGWGIDDVRSDLGKSAAFDWESRFPCVRLQRAGRCVPVIASGLGGRYGSRPKAEARIRHGRSGSGDRCKKVQSSAGVELGN